MMDAIMIILQQTVIGLTFGQIIAVLTLTGGIITVWVNLNAKIAKMETQIVQLDKLRTEDCKRNDAFRGELNDKIDKLHDKIDSLMDTLLKRRTK